MPLVDPPQIAREHFDVVVIGSGFGSAFFVLELLKQTKLRVLMLEWGAHHPHDWQWEHQQNSAVAVGDTYKSNSDKPWNYTIALGGGTNCWFAQTPRFHPTDFRLRSLYGIGNDWPISYEDLEPYYCAAEEIMSVSGDGDMHRQLPRSRPFPQPPHRPSTPDQAMKAKHPDMHFIMPTARAREANHQRGPCCASLRCWLCPADAKFTANNGLMDVFENERVTVCTGCEVLRLESAGSNVKAVTFLHSGREYQASGDLFVLGANGIQSPAIMLRSDLGGGFVGKGLHESYGWEMEVFLDGMDNFDGSTITTGLNYALYDGAHRRDAGGALVYFENRWKHGLRADRNRLRQTLPVMITVEDLLQDENEVTLDPNGQAFVQYHGHSAYAETGMRRAISALEGVLSPLPVETIHDRGVRPTESHVQGTLRMGLSQSDSVIDRDHLHHRLRNLVVVGSSCFPTSSAANPSLTVAALSLRAADRISRKGET